nr:hypothetical protein [Tanacetum cinerariifolium]
MSSITTQQAKLNLEPVPREKRMESRKCNIRLNPRNIQREPTFQVVLDVLALTLCYYRFLITTDVLEEDFIYQIDNKAYKKQEKIYYPRFTKVIIHYFLTQDKTLSWRNKIRMHTSRDDYLINTLRFVSAKKETQIYGAILPVSLTIHKMKETQAYRKSMREFHKTHPSGSGTVTKTTPSVAKIKPFVTSEGTGVKLGVPDVTGEESSDNSEHETDESESSLGSDHEENKEDEDDEEEVKDEFVKTLSNDSDEKDKTKITDKAEGNEDMDYTTSQLYDDVDIRLIEPVDTDKGFVQEEDAEIVSSLDVHVYHEVTSQQTQYLSRVTTLEKEVAKLKKDPLHTQVTALVDDHLDMVKESLEYAVLGKESSQPQSSNKAASILIEFELKKILIDKMDKSESYLKPKRQRPYARSDQGLKKRKTSKDAELTKEPTDPDWNVGKTPQQEQNQSWLMTLASYTKKPSKTFDELMGTPIDFSAFIMNILNINNLTQETLFGPAFRLLKGTNSNYAKLEYNFEECYKALSEKLDWENPEGDDYPFDLTKPLPLVMSGNRQKPMINMHYEESHIGANNVRPSMGMHEACNPYMMYILQTYSGGNSCQGDFPRLRINNIKDMRLLVVHNRLTNLSGDDVSDFAIALRMFTRSLVIQKRVEDLQLEVKSYQNKININKPETTKSGIKKRDLYTPYQDPQRFIYVDDSRRNRLMHSDELYNFSDGTLKASNFAG